MSTKPQLQKEGDLFPGEKADLKEEIREVVPDPETWLTSPNDHLGGREPIDLIGKSDESLLRDLVRAIKYVGVS